MNYAMIDNVLHDWAAKHGLRLDTLYQDSDVRTVFLQGSGSERGQIWVDQPSSDGKIIIHAAVYRKRGKDNRTSEMPASTNDLGDVLERAYALVVGWLNEPV